MAVNKQSVQVSIIVLLKCLNNGFKVVVCCVGNKTVVVHLIHFYRHGSVEHLARERESCLVHVHSTYYNEILGQGQTFSAEMLDNLCYCWFRITSREVREQRVYHRFRHIFSKRVERLDDWVGQVLFTLKATTLNGTQKLCEVFLHWSKVHLVETQEERHLGMLPCLDNKLNEGREHIMRTRNVRQIADYIHWVVPVWLHLYQLKVGWRVQRPTVIGKVRPLISFSFLQFFCNCRLC